MSLNLITDYIFDYEQIQFPEPDMDFLYEEFLGLSSKKHVDSFYKGLEDLKLD